MLTVEPPTPHRDGTNSPGKRSLASGKHPGPMSPTTPPRHRNDSPGRNIIQVSCTITAQSIQMLVTPHPRRGHNPPTQKFGFLATNKKNMWQTT
ncbi:hypothetical protein AMECASPLE_012282 [Ameca splendens]|uniref:Uncharacterized protein n=1 Tax=Ameca splendens TaxID=208324 RepID=A0ABV0Y1A2_9TELE